LFGNSSGLIKNCHVEGIIIGTSSNSFIAGLAGVNSGTISNCSASISLTGAGVIAGWEDLPVTIVVQ
jgi:hypothetical protein